MARNSYNDHLREVPMFADLSDKELTAISQLTTQYNAIDGEELLAQGSNSLEMFFVVHGTLAVLSNGEEIGTISDGDFVGELSLLAHRHRLVSVKSNGASELLHLDGRQFSSLLNRIPEIAVKMLPGIARHATEVTARAFCRQSDLDG